MSEDRGAKGISYKDAGVDIAAKARAIDKVRERAGATLGSQAGAIGHFGGTWSLPAGPEQVLVASADGVGTKLRLAFALGGDAHARVGHDLVNHCVNDILALGASPLFFLDYFATGVLDPDVMAAVIGGVSDGCLENGMALIGGETAEMPDMYAPGEYDLAGFIVGTVAPDRVVDGSAIQPGDTVIGIPSTGLHTNGYSLARKVVGLTGDPALDAGLLDTPITDGTSIGEALMAPHRAYRPDVAPLLEAGLVRGMAHITGGGLQDNLPRTLPETCVAVLDPSSWSVPAVFSYLIGMGDVPASDHYQVFNMGIGFVVVVAQESASTVLDSIADAVRIGTIRARRSADEPAVQGLDTQG